jgi:hypothetical protein
MSLTCGLNGSEETPARTFFFDVTIPDVRVYCLQQWGNKPQENEK